MKSRFAPVKRPLLALGIVAAMIVGSGLFPAGAISDEAAQALQPVTHNNLSGVGTTGRVRVRSQFQDRTGLSRLQEGDTKDRSTNPNRTVGDVPSVFGALPGSTSPCVPAATDCLRTLDVNDATVNPSASDTHTHYHAGDTFLIVNEVAGFAAGDTILIGSPYCNHALLQLQCKRFIPGLGLVDEQPDGEIAHVVGGDIGPSERGPGRLELSLGLAKDHLEGSTVTKLPTLYPGQQFRVDIDHTDLLDCDLAFLTCNPNDVEVRAWFLPPQGAHDNSFPRRPLALHRDEPNGPFAALVPAACGVPGGCGGTGFFSFYIPKEVTGTGTVGKTFDVNTPDTWYTVIIEATDVVTGQTVADGITRFKLNPVAITDLKAENPTRPGANFVPMETVEITGDLRDNTSAPALARRPVEDVIVDVKVTKPDGSSNRYQTTSCVDTDPSSADVCGGNVFGSQPNGHGAFFVTHGGPQGVYAQIGPNFTCNEETNLIVPCAGAIFTMMDTFDTGTYQVDASLRGYDPPSTASTTFLVELF